MHPLLRRQLQRLGLSEGSPPSLAGWQALLGRVGEAYEESEPQWCAADPPPERANESEPVPADARRPSESGLARERDKLRALNWFLDSIIENIPDMVFVKDASSLEFVRINRAGETLLGIAREELLGRGDHDFFPKDQADAFIDKDREVLRRKEIIFVEDEPIQTRANGPRSLSTTRIPILDERGEPTYVLGISRDITQHKDTRARLEQAKEHERASRAKSAFLANMSHELRTPLNSIIGFSEMLEDRVPGPLNDRQARYVSNVLASSRHLLRVIGDILDISKLEAGRMRLHLARMDVGAAVRRIEAAIQPLASKKSIELRSALGEGDLSAIADEQRIDQILYNLLSNAVKFTPDGGRIELETQRTADGIQVSVRDTGIGIAAEDLERIFLEFEQADSSYTRAQQGTGLGLSLTRRLVELHAGRLWVESVPGAGSVFAFVIPERKDSTPAGNISSEAPASG